MKKIKTPSLGIELGRPEGHGLAIEDYFYRPILAFLLQKELNFFATSKKMT